MKPTKDELEKLKGFPGVVYHQRSGKYLAFTIFDGKRHLGGLWETFEEAIIARDELKKRLGKE